MPVEPADPFVEAIRSAQEIGAQIVFADPDSNERPHLPDTYPDSYALTSIPLSQYVEAYRVYPQERTAGVGTLRRRNRVEAAGRRPACASPRGSVAESA